MTLQVVLVGTLVVDTENYLEGFRGEFDLADGDEVDTEALIDYTKEQVVEELQSGDSEIEEAEFVSVTRK